MFLSCSLEYFEKLPVENLFQILLSCHFSYRSAHCLSGEFVSHVFLSLFRESCLLREASLWGGPKFAYRPVFMLISHSHFMQVV